MLSIKEKVAKNYEDHPISERNEIIEIELKEEDHAKIKQLAKSHDISVEEYIFMLLVDKLDEHILSLPNELYGGEDG